VKALTPGKLVEPVLRVQVFGVQQDARFN